MLSINGPPARPKPGPSPGPRAGLTGIDVNPSLIDVNHTLIYFDHTLKYFETKNRATLLVKKAHSNGHVNNAYIIVY